MPILPYVAALLVLVMSSPVDAVTGFDPAMAPRIDAIFADYAKPGSPGCALALYERGRVLYQKGYGLASVEHGVAIDPQRTVFDIGSTSKQIHRRQHPAAGAGRKARARGQRTHLRS